MNDARHHEDAHARRPSLRSPLRVAAGGYGLYRVGMQRGMGRCQRCRAGRAPPPAAPTSATTSPPAKTRRAATSQPGLKAGDIDPATGKQILY